MKGTLSPSTNNNNNNGAANSSGGMISPRDLPLFNNEGHNNTDCSNAIKVISFGQSRCTSSSRMTDQFLMNASLGTPH